MARAWGALAVGGVGGFLGLVGYLHQVQIAYDPVQQLMSELALGVQGGLMRFAFLSIALALFALAMGLGATGGRRGVRFALGLAALGFVGAGVWPLGETTEVHVALVALAFIASGLAMYWLPSSVSLFAGHFYRALSWLLLCVLAVSVALGGVVVPVGVAQRIAAGALLAWVLAVGGRLVRA